MSVPTEIEKILVNIENKKPVTDEDQLKVRTFLGTLETSIVNPANNAKILTNPNPIEVDVSFNRPQTLEERIKRIMSVSARLAESRAMESPEESDDFEVTDGFEVAPAISPFEMVDHFAPMQPESPMVDPTDPVTPTDVAPVVNEPEPEPEPTSGGGE